MYYSDEERYEQEYLPEVNIFERIAYEAPAATRLEIQNDPVKRFRVYVNAIANSFASNKSLPINMDDVNEISTKSNIVKNPQYKNPLGFVLGYFITKNGDNNINNKNLKYVEDNLELLSGDNYVKIEDVIRYGRLWLSLV